MDHEEAQLGPAARRQELRRRLQRKEHVAKHRAFVDHPPGPARNVDEEEHLEEKASNNSRQPGEDPRGSARDADQHERNRGSLAQESAATLNARVLEGVRGSVQLVRDRQQRDEDYHSRQALRMEQSAEAARIAVVAEGQEFVRQIHEGRVLFHGTGLPGKDGLLSQTENPYTESDLLAHTHEEWTLRSPELRETLAALSPRTKQLRSDRDEALEATVAIAHTNIEKKRDFLRRIQRADREATQAHEDAEQVAAEAFALLDKLRKQHNVLSFEARAKTRRLMLAKQVEASTLRKSAEAAKADAKQLKRHMIERGLEPDSFVSVSTVATPVPAASDSNAPLAKRLKLPALAASANETNDGETSEAPTPASPDPQDWHYQLREGLKMSHLELMDSSQRRQHRMADAEVAMSRQQEQELARIKQRVRLAKQTERAAQKAAGKTRPPSQESERSVSTAASSQSLASEVADAKPRDDEKDKDDDDALLDATDFVAAAMTAENVSLQDRAILGKPANIDASIVRGMTLETAPPFCKDWGLKQRCMLAQCPGRHFYVSREEANEWQERRAAVDASLEMNVLDAIASREQLIATARQEAEACRRRFQSHLSGHVQTEDVGSLLYLLNKMRVASVRVVEALVKWRESGEMHFTSAEGATETFAQAFLKPRGWVVKMGFHGERLYGGSKAFQSKIKRFNRDQDVDGKKALRFRYVGVYETREEALRAYEDEVKRLMAREMCGPENFPRPKTIIRACGKHFAVESDMGVANTRCEICFANSFNHFGKYTPAYMWNGQNYLLKMLHDVNFLQDIELLRLFFKSEFEQNTLSFRGNPFLLAADVLEGNRRKVRVRKVRSEADLAGEASSAEVAATFGVPTDAVVIHGNECVEWHGHMSRGPQVSVGKQRAYISMHVTSRKLVDEFVRKYEARTFEIVDMRRIRAAQQVLREEADLARYMSESRLDAKAKAAQVRLAAEKQARREDRARRRELGETVSSSSEGDSSSEEDDQGGASRDEERPRHEHGRARGAKGNARKTAPIFRQYKIPDILSEAEIADLSNGSARRRKIKFNHSTQAERLAENRLHTAFFWERGEYIAVQQVRHELVGKKPGVWATGDPGTTFSGMQVHGEHRKHFDFQRKLKEQGKALIARRQRIQKRLAKSLRRGDACNTETIMQLVQLGREAQGSLLLMDCENAELFVQRWHRRAWAAGIIQRNMRAARARAYCTQLRLSIATTAERELRRGRNCLKVARRFTRGLVRKSVKRAKLRLKKPFLTEAVEYDGERVLVSVHDARKVQRHRRASAALLETCFACRGLFTRTRERRDLAWLSVRGEPCIPGNLEACDRGVVRLERVFRTGATAAPCYCRRAHPEHDRLLFEAYHPATSETFRAVFSLTSLLRGLRAERVSLRPARNALQEAAARLLACGDNLLRVEANRGALVVVPSEFAPRANRPMDLRMSQLLDVWTALARRQRHGDRLLRGMQQLVRGSRGRSRKLRAEFEWRQRADTEASSHLGNAHATILAAQVHKHAMVQACDTALNFSKRQIELYEDLSLSTNQQAWDPPENANNAVYIQRKWQATKAVDLAIHVRNLAVLRAFQASIEHSTSRDLAYRAGTLFDATRRELLPIVKRYAQDTRKVCDVLHAALKTLVHESVHKFVTLQHGLRTRAGRLSRALCLARRLPANRRSTVDHNTLYRQGRLLVSPPFVDFVPQSLRALVQVFELEAPSTLAVPAIPPAWMRSRFTDACGMQAFDPAVTLDGPVFRDFPLRPTVDEAMRMLVRDTRAWDNSLAHQWALTFDVRDAIVQPPYMGTIRVSVYEAGASRATEWELDPIDLRLLLLEPHAGIPGCPIPEVFSYAYVRDLLLSSREADGTLTHQSMRDAVGKLRDRVVARLVQLIHLDVFDGGLRLGKLYFQRLRRKLFNSLFTTQWWKDLRLGRSSLQGHLVYGGPHMIAGASAMATVFENQGDLTIRVCWSWPRILADGTRVKRCRVTLRDESIRRMFEDSGDLESFILWKQSVKCCSYPKQVIEEILRNLTLEGAERRGLCASSQHSAGTQGPAYTGKERYVFAGKPLRTRPEFLPLGDARGPRSEDPLKLVTNTRALYELVHREVLFISGLHLIVSGRLRADGDVLIEAARQDQGTLSIRLSKARVRDLLHRSSLEHLLERERSKELFATFFALLAVRSATRPPHTIREHPSFARYCKMLQVGVPRGAVAHAILHDGERKAPLAETMRLVLDSDNGAHPPAKFRLAPRTYEVLIFSQTRPDEHFRLLHRGLVTARAGMPVSMDILERNRNLWLRVRRETRVEKDARVCRVENLAMVAEDALSQEAMEQTALYNGPRARPLRNSQMLDPCLARAVSLSNQVARCQRARLAHLQDVLDNLGLDAETRTVVWPDCAAETRVSRTVAPLRARPAAIESVRRIDGIGCVLRCWHLSQGIAIVQVRVPSWSVCVSKSLDLDRVSAQRWQEAEEVFAWARGAALEHLVAQKLPPCIQASAQTLLRGASRHHGLLRVRYSPVGSRIFVEGVGGETFVSSSSEREANPESAAASTRAEAKASNDSPAVVQDGLQVPIPAALVDEEHGEVAGLQGAGVKRHVVTQAEVAEAAQYATPGTAVNAAAADWRLEFALLDRYTIAAAKSSPNDVVMCELLDKDARVGQGPVAGGALPEDCEDADRLVKHSVTLPADVLDILACGGRSDPPLLAQASSASTAETQRLVEWLSARTRFVMGNSEDGSEDAVSFDREFLRHGRLMRSATPKADLRCLVLRGVISDRGDVLTVESFTRSAGRWTPQITLELKRGQTVTRGSAIHAFINLVPQHEGVEAVVADFGEEILEPRRIQELLRRLLDRSLVAEDGGHLHDREAFALRMYASRREREQAVTHSAQEQRDARKCLDDACRKLCSGERERYIADLEERAARFRRLQDIRVAVPGWEGMTQEDATAQAIRGYLACEFSKLAPIEKAFAHFDGNRDGGLDKAEFRALAFSIGHVLTTEEAAEALALIDSDGNGSISQQELGIWALCAAPAKQRDMRFRKLQLELRVSTSLARAKSMVAGSAPVGARGAASRKSAKM